MNNLDVSKLVTQTSSKRKNIFYYLRKDALLYALCIPAILYYVVFSYIPMYGVTIAFKNFNIFAGINNSPWIGFDMFKEIFRESFFWLSVRNTLVLNILVLLVNFPSGIILALMLNEITHLKFKKITQTLMYLPHFISWVVIVGLVFNIFSIRTGSVNNIIKMLGFEPISFLGTNGWWIFTYVITHLWKSIGWSTIIYLAALAGVDESLYEAAYIDGASKFQRLVFITIPCIKPTIVVMFILAIGGMMSIGIDAPLLLQNSGVANVSEVISTYVYKMGLQQTRYSFATAVNLFQSLVNITLVLSANFFAKAMGEEGVI